MADKPSPWNVSPVVTSITWVKTQDGRDIPLRYTEFLDDGKIHIIVEVWPLYPGSYSQVVFRHELIA